MKKTIETRFSVGDKVKIWETKTIGPKNDFEKYPHVAQPITEQTEIDVIIEKVFIEINEQSTDIKYLLANKDGNRFYRTESSIIQAQEEKKDISIAEKIERIISQYVAERKSGILGIGMNDDDYKKSLEYFITDLKINVEENAEKNVYCFVYGGVGVTIKKL